VLLAGAILPAGTFTRRTTTPFQGIHNNLVENAIRPTAIGKKNWLFVGEANAGERSAIIYTLIESCRRRGLDPYAYLREVLTRLPNMTNRQIPEVTPAAWIKNHLHLQKVS
jgi:transposase